MHNRLSIFSSKPVHCRASRLLTCAVSLIAGFFLLAILNFIFSRATLPYKTNSQLGEVVRYLWHESSKRTDSPSVLFLGSSIFNSGILPDVFESYSKERGVTARFINASQPSMGYWEFSKILSLVDLQAMNTKVCVVEVDPWTFNKTTRHPITKEIIKHARELDSWGSLSEVLAVEGFFLKCKLLAKTLLPKRSVKDVLYIIRGLLYGGPQISQFPDPPTHVDMKKELQRNNPNFFAENISKCHMMDYEFSTIKRDQFLAFIENLKMQDVEVVLVQPPVKRSYFNYVNEDAVRSAEYKKHLQFLEDISAQYRTLVWQGPRDAGVDDSVFVDYGHYSLEGASVFSGLIADRIQDIIGQLNPPEGDMLNAKSSAGASRCPREI